MELGTERIRKLLVQYGTTVITTATFSASPSVKRQRTSIIIPTPIHALLAGLKRSSHSFCCTVFAST